MNYKVIALAAFALVYVYQMLLQWIDMRSEKNPIPANVRDVYDAETYQKWRSYHAEKSRFGMLRGTVSFVIELALLACSAHAAFARLFPEGHFPQLFAVVLLMSLVDVLLIPFEYYDTMHIEEKYGFNRATAATFWADQAKTFVISMILSIGIASLLMGMHLWLGDGLIIAFAVVMTLFVLAFAFLYPVFSRIFNKFEPLPDGELKDKLTALLEQHGFKVRAIQVMDASRRSSKSNAYFSGFGKMKTIVLYDTLIQQMEPDEICAVFAHELGHGLHRDTLKNQILTFVQMMIVAALAWLTLRTEAVFTDFGFDGINYGFAMLLIMSVEFALIQPLYGLLTNAVSRRAEYRADAQAVQEGYGAPLISGLKKLARENFADLAPSPLLVKLEYSHPTMSQRIDAIEAGIDRLAKESRA